MSTSNPFDYPRANALVTGASRGIGLSIARELAARGCPHLVLTARTESDLEALAAELSARHGTKTHIIAADLSEASAPQTIKAATDTLGLSIDLLVNNAGFGDYGSYGDRPLDRQERMIVVNCTALVALTRLYLPGLIARGHGGIVNIASTAAFQPVPYMSVYGATKAFVLSFSEALWAEMADTKTGVRVVCLCPGGTATAFDFGTAEGRGQYENTLMSTPEDVAKATLRALDKNASFAVVGAANYVGTFGARLLPRATLAQVTASFLPPNRRRKEKPPAWTAEKDRGHGFGGRGGRGGGWFYPVTSAALTPIPSVLRRSVNSRAEPHRAHGPAAQSRRRPVRRCPNLRFESPRPS